MTTTTLYLCRDPVGAHWQLGAVPRLPYRVALIGWVQQPPAVDGGVPDQIAALLAETLTAVGSVSFFCRKGNTMVAEASHVQTLTSPTLSGWLTARLQGFPRGASLLTTRSPEAAYQLFWTHGFSWVLQGQIALLFKPGTEPPRLTVQSAQLLLSEHWADHVAALGSSGAIGALRPGVDGDVAAFLALTEEIAVAFRNTLCAVCAEHQIAFESCTEDVFAARLAQGRRIR
jgi:hypothetical protein